MQKNLKRLKMDENECSNMTTNASEEHQPQQQAPVVMDTVSEDIQIENQQELNIDPEEESDDYDDVIMLTTVQKQIHLFELILCMFNCC